MTSDSASAAPRGPPAPRSVRARLLALTLAALLPALAIAGAFLARSYQVARARAEQQLLATTRALALGVDRQLGQYEVLLRTLASSPQLLDGDLRAFDARVRRIAPPGTWVVVMDTRGQQLVNTRVPLGTPLPVIPYEPAQRRALEAGRAYTCDLFPGPVAREPVLCLDVPVVVDGRLRLDLGVGFTPATLRRLLAEQNLPPSWYATILDGAYHVVARTRDHERYLGVKASDYVVATLGAHREGTRESTTLDGTPTVMGYSRLPTYGWPLVVAAPRAELFAEPRKALWAGLALSLLLLGLGGVLSLYAAAPIRRSLEALAHAAAEHPGGGAPLAPSGVTEVDTAREALERSAEAVRQSEARLRELNEALERRVREATEAHAHTLAQLHQAQKLETIGQLTGGIAHDFNNLLTPIVFGLELLRARVGEDPKALRHVTSAMASAERARTLVSRLLVFAGRQMLEARPVDVGGLVLGLRDLLHHSLGPQHTVVLEAPAGLPAAQVDPNQLELALLNLAVNARDAMPQGGVLTVTAQEEHVPGGPHAAGLAPGRYVRLSVVDTGCGMDEPTLRRAVEPFFSTKGLGKGTGLGLSMVHGLATQSGGALRLSSSVGLGTRAELWLPVAATPAEPLRAEDAEVPRAPFGALVLLVDDEPVVRAAAAEMLRELGYQVLEAGSATDALQQLAAGATPDALVTDYMMPGRNGVELVEAVRARWPALPALLITGYSTAAHVPDDVAVLLKPFRQAQLAQRLAHALTAPVGRARKEA